MFTKDQWFSHIQSIHQQRIALGLDRVLHVGKRLGVTSFACPVIMVAGTNGKGSCVKTLETIYASAGYCVGLYTSPHLLEFNERIRIHHQMIDDRALLNAFSIVEAARENIVLSFFEFTTLAALVLFQQASCDVVILEVGLGGRLDAVNIVEPDVTILTSIGFDHMDFLGDTLEAIGYEKAAIARPDKPFICAEENPPRTVFDTVAQKKGIFYHIHQDFFYDEKKYPKPHLKKENVAAAIFASELLQARLPVSEESIKAGIVNTEWPGRFEIIETPFSCVLDVAHNPQSSAFLAKQYQTLSSVKTVGIVGMLKDKAHAETIVPLLPLVDEWFVCDLSRIEKERGDDGKSLCLFLKKNQANYRHFASVSDAMTEVDCQRQYERALIFGSFYTVAAAKRWLLKDKE